MGKGVKKVPVKRRSRSGELANLDIRFIRTALGMSQIEFARFLHCGQVCVYNWERKSNYPRGLHLFLLVMTDYVLRNCVVQPHLTKLVMSGDNEEIFYFLLGHYRKRDNKVITKRRV